MTECRAVGGVWEFEIGGRLRGCLFDNREGARDSMSATVDNCKQVTGGEVLNLGYNGATRCMSMSRVLRTKE